jgi:adenosylcobinamide kinase / adenosylcobinamide-phosphate guanylyltransferase
LKKIILLLGGARSGKSFHAQELAKKLGKVLFVATATAGDEDMRLRIEKHKRDRPVGWRTLEATEHLGTRIEDEIADGQVVIIDCITLLLSNIFCRYDEQEFENIAESIIEQQVLAEIKELQNCLAKVEASFIIISNEVGLGIVPETRMGRLYRDLLGKANQKLAQSADEVSLMIAGIPLQVKPSNTL